jgi:hypothetical protein
VIGESLRKDGAPSDPRYSDGYVNAEALHRLAVMSGRQVPELQFALPNLRGHRLLPEQGGPAWDWPWDARGCFLVRVCEVCARIKGTGLLAYLAADAPWDVCLAHRRWLDNRREPGTAAISLGGLPEVVEAHRQRLLLERRLGAGGRALFADAYAIVSLWWNVRALNAPVWRERRLALGRAGHDGLRVAPLVFYPEAVRVAHALAVRERRRLRRTLTLNGHQQCWRRSQRPWSSGASRTSPVWTRWSCGPTSTPLCCDHGGRAGGPGRWRGRPAAATGACPCPTPTTLTRWRRRWANGPACPGSSVSCSPLNCRRPRVAGL